jgi:hypothetical protein
LASFSASPRIVARMAVRRRFVPFKSMCVVFRLAFAGVSGSLPEVVIAREGVRSGGKAVVPCGNSRFR